MKMYEAAESVLKDAGKPMSVKEIYEEIIKRNLFSFGAKDPVAVLGQTLRKRSPEFPKANAHIFKKVGPNLYTLAD